MASDLSAEIIRFIQEHIKTVASLDILLLMYRNPTREWTAEGIAVDLRTNPITVRGFLDFFVEKGLITRIADNRYQYRASAAALDSNVAALAREYSMRPVTVVNTIYSAPGDDKLQSFADAFKLKKD